MGQGTDSILLMFWIHVLTRRMWGNQLLGGGLRSPNAFLAIVFDHVSRFLFIYLFICLDYWKYFSI